MKGKDIQYAKACLERGELVGLPTETVYGLAGNALNPKAVASIFETKKRPAFDPLIVHCDSIEKVKDYVQEIPAEAMLLAEKFWPGPLTMVLPRKPIIHDLVTSGLDTVAVRVPNHPLSLALLKEIDFPVAAPSANLFGFVSPTTAEHVESGLGDKIGYVLDGGACSVGIESTIVGFIQGKPTVLRKGGISIEQIEAVIGPVEVKSHSSSQPEAPGMLKKHYSPGIEMIIGDIVENIAKYKDLKVATLSFKDTFEEIPNDLQFVLSSNGNLDEAAQNLFKMLRELGELDIDLILAELLPEEGLGVGINDRLRRAAAK
ncbi:L-threonylcarbamoyladenylate synthase [Sediminitomix flava]|uniref:Threonylcarbamoyl-AMP synthase n=1 Tax=Sediminitomix flava TaxID=379075 RepID=A0A315ZD02_SEDFL|nr:L-threonylcarbamoyladenylate synthase [Sediminitomix flava]PWJ42718.1 translation factor SUA5 [Sediminitomix flava]